MAVLSLDQGGTLGFLRFNGEWKFAEMCPRVKLDDIERFKDHICSVNHEDKFCSSIWLMEWRFKSYANRFQRVL